jgi:hypothetical protein
VDIDGEGVMPSLSIDDVTVTEGDGVPVTDAIFTVTLSASSSENVTVEFATSDDSATAGADYVTNSGTVTFPAGISTRTITIEVNDDSIEEPNEYFYVNLSNPTNATIADDRGVGTILDDDAPPPTPQITIDDVSVDEGGSGTTASADFNVILSAATTNTVTVDYATYSGPGTSANPGEDYEAATGTLTFLPGSTIETISVTVYGDDIDEPDENFFVDLSNPLNATILDNQGEGIIVNDDTPSPSGPQLELVKVRARTDQWTSVSLTKDYDDEMVVVCTPNYSISGLGPTVARVRNAVDDRFEVGLARPWFGAVPGDHWSTDVHCMVVRAGVYTEAEHGVKMEAVRLDNFTLTDNFRSWAGESQSYLNTYTRPVVVGQVIGGSSSIPGEIGDWSVFWTRGTTVQQPPSSSALYLGRHTGEDPSGRSMESIGYVVIEEGTGTIEGVDYAAALGSDTVRGVTNKPPYTYTLNGLSSVSTAILSQAGMDGANGGWAILYGSIPITASQIRMAIEEDWYRDSERNHTTEQVGYIVFE